MVRAGFIPDTISTHLHRESINTGLQDMLNAMDKFLLLGMSLEEVTLRSTWIPVKLIQHEVLDTHRLRCGARCASRRVRPVRFRRRAVPGYDHTRSMKWLALNG